MMTRKKGRRHAPTNPRPRRNDAEIEAIDAVLDALVIPPDPDKNLRFKRSDDHPVTSENPKLDQTQADQSRQQAD